MADIREKAGIKGDGVVYFRDKSVTNRLQMESELALEAAAYKAQIEEKAQQTQKPVWEIQWENDGRPQINEAIDGSVYYCTMFGKTALPRAARRLLKYNFSNL